MTRNRVTVVLPCIFNSLLTFILKIWKHDCSLNGAPANIQKKISAKNVHRQDDFLIGYIAYGTRKKNHTREEQVNSYTCCTFIYLEVNTTFDKHICYMFNLSTIMSSVKMKIIRYLSLVCRHRQLVHINPFNRNIFAQECNLVSLLPCSCILFFGIISTNAISFSFLFSWFKFLTFCAGYFLHKMLRCVNFRLN